MPSTWYTADPHFGHENVIAFCGRPFRSAGHMGEVLMENLWSKVAPEDALWIVGDFAFGPKAKDPAWLEMLFGQLPGAEKHLVIGNHDGAAIQALPWTSVTHLAEAVDAGARAAGCPGSAALPSVLCHYPMLTWRQARKGALHLFGHVHGRWQGSRGAVNVGVDVWDFQPMRLADVAKRAAKLPPSRHWADVEHGAEVT